MDPVIKRFRRKGRDFTLKKRIVGNYDNTYLEKYKPSLIDIWDDFPSMRKQLETLAKSHPRFKAPKISDRDKKTILKRRIEQEVRRIEKQEPNITNTALAGHSEIAPLFEQMYEGMSKEHRLRILGTIRPRKPGRPIKR